MKTSRLFISRVLGLVLLVFFSVAIGTVKAGSGLGALIIPMATGGVQLVTQPGAAELADASAASEGMSGTGPLAMPLAAIFVRDRAGNLRGGDLEKTEEMILAKMNHRGFRIMSPSDTTRMIAKTNILPNGEAFDPVEEALHSNSGSMRLAQALNADFLMIVSVNSLTQDIREIDMYNTSRSVETNRLGLSYRMLHADWGDQVLGGSVQSQNTRSRSASYAAAGMGYLDQLIDDATTKLCADFDKRQQEFLKQSKDILARAASGEVTFNITPLIQDLTIPDIVRDQTGDYALMPTTLDVIASDVVVELDGLVIGSAPGELKARPGLHELKLTREGFRSWRRTVSLREGMDLRVAMQLNDEEIARWRERTRFLQGLATETKLVDAEVERVRGLAQMLATSGMRIDLRKEVDIEQRSDIDVTVDATSLPEQNVILPPGYSIWAESSND